MSLDKTYGWAYLAFFALFALGYSENIVDPVQLPRLMILNVFMIGLMFLLWKDSNRIDFNLRFLLRPVPLSMIILVLLIGISAYSAHLKFETLYVFSKSLSLLLFFILSVLIFRSGKVNMDSVSKAFGTFAFIVLAIALYQFLDNPGRGKRILSTMANENLLASILFLSFPFVLINLRAGTLWNIISMLTLIGSALMLWITQARGAMLAAWTFCFVVLIGLRFFLRAYDPVPRLTRIGFIVFVLFSIGGGVFVIHNQNEFTDILDSATLSERKVLWSNTIEMIKDNPVTGVGAGNWKIHNNAYGLEGFQAKARTGLEIFQRPHNDFLWVFSELGVLGFLVYLGFFSLIIVLCVQRIRAASEQSRVLDYLLILGALLGYIIIAMFGYPFERVEQQVFLSTFIALLIGVPAVAEKNKELQRKNTPVALLTLTGLIILSTSIIYINRLNGEAHTNKMYVAKAASNWNLVIAEADEAVNPFYKLDPSSTPIVWYKGVAEFAKGNRKEALMLFQEALELAPNDIHVLTNIAGVHAVEGNKPEAERYFERTIEIAPAYANPRINMAKIRYGEGRFDEAFEYLKPLPLNVKDPLFMDLLPVLLKKKSEKLINGLEDQAQVARINSRITSKPAIVELFRESKKRNLTFEEYLLTL